MLTLPNMLMGGSCRQAFAVVKILLKLDNMIENPLNMIDNPLL